MKRSYSSDGIKSDSDYSPAPVGIYTLIITEVNDTKDGSPWKTKNGDDYVSVVCEIDDSGDYLGKKVWHGVTFMDDKSRKGAGMSIHFLKMIGEPWEGEFEVNTDNWVGKRFKVKLGIGKDLKGRGKNEIASIIDENTVLDDVPF